MSVHDAQPGDIYADEIGKLWRIISVCHEPTVTAEEVEGALIDPNLSSPTSYSMAQASLAMQNVQRIAFIQKAKRSGGTSGLMWAGWQRIFRKTKIEST